MTDKFFMRWMIAADMDWVSQTEWMCFDDPMTRQEFTDILKRRNCIGLVATLNDELAGYMLYELMKEKYYMITFAVHEDFRRRKVGTRMMDKMLAKFRPSRNRIEFEVRDDNLRGQLFLKKMGFRATGVTGDYYPMVREKVFLNYS